ncbi:dol-p-glc:glc(2)man(9)glcnac(2)-pp-dol alpha-1 2-glucosyltransferase [Phtheirospermum japonicum]|uniref:Dol-P-Glc:Glc(2)Man(9)GlcNAc(2)-PP-Dol alpha-1,2-glucosyltransferase n=1 Tax=Phtheirospermum japonicum TaxID=374723 RepID=A0A830D9H8_9LAMI|nr:dol-p-glc:glc(2)man(9)glcnac(2)-pp-dol alpha-1 2-glucosyltransferase [Phtheirospermum japonicum]
MGRVVVASIIILWLIPISILVNQIVRDPYMDEIFHVPQAQQYCGGNFRSWDPMITTPPGLYFLSLAYVASLFPGLFCMQAVSSFSDACTASVLRLTNGVLAVICSVLVYEIIVHLKPSLDDKKATLRAVVLSLYPLHWFFTFLYYTDVASLTSVLAMYLLMLRKKYLFSSLAIKFKKKTSLAPTWAPRAPDDLFGRFLKILGALSVLIRQTNIIWMLFVACTGVIEFTRSHQKDSAEIDDISASKEKDDMSTPCEGVPTTSNLRKRRGNSGPKSRNKLSPQKFVSMTRSSGLLDEIQDVIVISWNHFWELLVSLSPFFMVFVAFVAFVRWNGSIVLGAKDAHSVSPHFPQVLYFGLVSALFVFPVHFSLGQAAFVFQQHRERKLLGFFQCFTALTIGFLSVHYFSIAHPYLLADNRHYPFYLWRKVVNYHWSTKYLMVPLYVYSWFSIVCNLVKKQKKLWVLVYFFACAASLIPAPLIEFRYFTIPFFFLVLNIDITDKSWIVIGILYFVVNCFTMFTFLFRPFAWKHEGGTQRFIW